MEIKLNERYREKGETQRDRERERKRERKICVGKRGRRGGGEVEKKWERLDKRVQYSVLTYIRQGGMG